MGQVGDALSAVLRDDEGDVAPFVDAPEPTDEGEEVFDDDDDDVEDDDWDDEDYADDDDDDDAE